MRPIDEATQADWDLVEKDTMSVRRYIKHRNDRV